MKLMLSPPSACEKTEAQKRGETCLRPHNQWRARPHLEPESPASRPQALPQAPCNARHTWAGWPVGGRSVAPRTRLLSRTMGDIPKVLWRGSVVAKPTVLLTRAFPHPPPAIPRHNQNGVPSLPENAASLGCVHKQPLPSISVPGHAGP